MTQKQTLSHGEHPGLGFYDLIMLDIEPDLCSSNIDRLEELYPDESKVSKGARKERYEKAFEQFDTLVKTIKDARAADAKEEKNKMKKKLNKQETSEKLGDVSSAEQMLESFDDQS